VLIGAIGGYNQTSIRKILTFSSYVEKRTNLCIWKIDTERKIFGKQPLRKLRNGFSQ
jgi:hypothetical protein